jgi:ABC-type transport system involved in multi-copper enzyme maturation permease subunit
MLVLHNILSVAKYESKLLVRSWFFKVFSTIAVLVAFGYSLGTLSDAGSPTWLLRAIPSTIPYGTLILLNAAQAVIAIFLSSEFIKRDKQLDTSEVFYGRPLSNAEYVIGKTWGNLRVFLGLNLVILLIALLLI